ncbi:MAG: TRZ/ATZ family hydrolase [Pseudohongiellaceae bacterium]
MTEAVDLLIHADWVVPVEPHDTILRHHSIAIRNQRIVGLLKREETRGIRAEQELELPHHVLIPGLVNAHGHAAMSLLRGVADDLPLQEWLQDHIWPLESEHVSEAFVSQGAELAIAEMLCGGTTCFTDMYFFPEAVAKMALKAGMRVQLASPVLDFPTVWAQNADEYIHKATELHDSYRNSELIHTAFGPHAPYTVSDDPLRRIQTLAEELDIPIHMHVHETAGEVADAVAAIGKRPLARLADLGLLGPRLVCVHATQLNDEEIAQLSHFNASVVHCPESNMKLASGFCEVARLLRAGINVALGTDGCASNNDLDMFSEMRTAALLGKAVAADATALPAATVLRMATLNGARALGLESLIGSLEPGKLADITAVNLEKWSTLPVYNPVSHLVYSASASQVSHVWIGGRAVLTEGKLQTLDPPKLRRHIAGWQELIQEQACKM